MDGFMQTASDLWQKFASNPTQQTHALLGGILFATTYIAFRRKKRCRINVDCPPGEKVFVQVGDDDEKE